MSRDLKLRLGGLFGLALSAFVGWLGIWRPLQQAEAGAPEAVYSPEHVVMMPCALIFGLFFLLGGERLPYRDERKRLTPAGWVISAIAATAGTATYLWMQARMTALGYG